MSARRSIIFVHEEIPSAITEALGRADLGGGEVTRLLDGLEGENSGKSGSPYQMRTWRGPGHDAGAKD